MRPDTPAENVDHNAEAARLERTAGLYPDDAEALLVDGGMLPFLPPNWQAVAAAVMRRPEMYVHDRATFRLVPAVRATAA